MPAEDKLQLYECTVHAVAADSVLLPLESPVAIVIIVVTCSHLYTIIICWCASNFLLGVAVSIIICQNYQYF